MVKKPKQYKPNRVAPKKKYRRPGLLSAREKGYNSKWDKYRFRFLHHNPKCYTCGQKATVVDHYVAWKVDKEKYFWNEENFMPLCRGCHNYVTGKFDQHKEPKCAEKSEWVREQREKYNITTKIVRVSIPKETK
jgi:hypothetical protein